MTQIERDHFFMEKALRLAAVAASKAEVPVGAVLVAADGSTVLSQGYNLRESIQSPLAHAELLALQRAAKKLGSWRLTGCTLYVTLEPCPMCAGALINSRIGRLVYGARDPKAGACGSLLELGSDQRFNHRFEVIGGVFADEASYMLKSFFSQLRQKK